MMIPLYWVTLTAILLSILVDIKWEISKLAVSINFSKSVTALLCSILTDGQRGLWLIFFVGGIVRASSVIAGWGFVVVPLEAVSTCIIKCAKYMRPCVVSMTTLLFLMKCNPIIGPVIFFIKTNCSTNTLSPFSNLSVAVANRFSNWPLATCI